MTCKKNFTNGGPSCFAPLPKPADDAPDFIRLHDMNIESVAHQMAPPNHKGDNNKMVLGLINQYSPDCSAKIETPFSAAMADDLKKLFNHDVELYVVRKGPHMAALGMSLIKEAFSHGLSEEDHEDFSAQVHDLIGGNILTKVDPLEEAGFVTKEQLNKLDREHLGYSVTDAVANNDKAAVVEVDENRAPLGPALVWDNTQDVHVNPTLQLNGVVVCEARNVMTHHPRYGAPITFEEHTRERRVNGFVYAQEEQTDCFLKGTAQQVKFKAIRVLPATIIETQIYLQLKYGYQLIKEQRNDKDSN